MIILLLRSKTEPHLNNRHGGAISSPLSFQSSMNNYGGSDNGISMGGSATTPDGAANNVVGADVDVTSVIQEKPGMYAYPYRVQPGKFS